MRAVVLLLAVALAPQAAAQTVAPPPREIENDPRRPARMDAHRGDKDPVLRDLARGHLKPGDPVDALIRLNPHYEVIHHGAYTSLRYDPTGYGGTHLIARDGKLVFARTTSCIYRDVFFDLLTAEERGEAWTGYGDVTRKLVDFKLTVPAIIGGAAGRAVWLQPNRSP